jgi:hypothetical protein
LYKITKVFLYLYSRKVFNNFLNINFVCAICSVRCLKGEGEIEKLQTKALELQRKLDNTTAAVQELGRENQSLQVRRLLTPGLLVLQFPSQ